MILSVLIIVAMTLLELFQKIQNYKSIFGPTLKPEARVQCGHMIQVRNGAETYSMLIKFRKTIEITHLIVKL